MGNDQGFANLIYEYFVRRFFFQYYKYGEQLPTIESLCRQFNVSSLTIKSAFSRLQKEGYILRSRGRNATVIFQQNDQALDDYAIRFFSERMAAVPDLCQSVELVLMPMLLKGFRHLNEKDCTYLEQCTEQPNPEHLMQFYFYILQKAGNPLILNLFWENILFLGLPFPSQYRGQPLYDASQSREKLKKLLDCGKGGDSRQIRDANLDFQRNVTYQFLNYIEQRIPTAPKTSQISFNWRVYRDRPQICCGLAIKIIHDVYMADYQDAAFLPSYEKMAGKYGVSVSTMRRTISLLNQLGATQSVNGKGTRILMMHDSEDKKNPDLANPTIRHNMAYYIQSFELLAESCEGVMRVALTSFSQEKKEELTTMLEKALQTKRFFIAPQCIFAFVAEHSPLQGITEIYGKLYGLNLWGYPMNVFRKRMPDLGQTLLQFTTTVIRSLKDNDIDGFAQTIGSFMKSEYRTAKGILLEHGFTMEELQNAPSFSLLQPK